MDVLNAVWRFSFGGSSDVAAGQKTLEAIQALLVQAVRTHEGAALSAEEIAPVKALCDQLRPANFQLSVPTAGGGGRGPERPKRVHYQHVYEDETFSIGIFILPPGVGIPLHDHPGMSVISRVLYGSLHIKSYDLVSSTDAGEIASSSTSGKKLQAARQCSDEIITAPHTGELLPNRGNLHEFVGGDEIGCAIFDILTPPYDVAEGRDCTYYRVVGTGAPAATGESKEKLVTLESFDPVDFDVTTEPYHGPRLQRYVWQ